MQASDMIEKLCDINERLGKVVKEKNEEIQALKSLIDELVRESDEAKRRYLVHKLSSSAPIQSDGKNS